MIPLVIISIPLGIIAGSTFAMGVFLGELETTISGKLEKIKWKLDDLNKTLKELKERSDKK